MKLFSIFLLGLLLVRAPQNIHGQSTEWAKWISDSYDGGVSTICRDTSGNIYVTGQVGSNGQVDGTSIGVSGFYDMFLIKFNAAGELQWSQRGGGGDPNNFGEGDSGSGVIYDQASNAVFVCGSYEGFPATFGSSISFSGNGGFLAKYSVEGECLWVRHTNHGSASSIHLDGAGHVIMTGAEGPNSIPVSILFAGAQPGDPYVAVPAGPFVAKYNTDGDLIWARAFGRDLVFHLVAMDERNVVFGTARTTNAELLGEPIPMNGSVHRGFIAVVDTAYEEVLLLQTFTSPVFSNVTNHSHLGAGGHIISGLFSDTLFLTTDTLYAPPGEYRPYVVRLDSTFTEQWMMDLGTNAYRSPRFSLFTDGTLALASPFVDSVQVGGQLFHASSELDFILVRMDPDGAILSAVNNGPITMSSMALETTSDGGVVLGSSFNGTIDLGNGHVLTGGADIFVAKFGGFTAVPILKTAANGELYIYANPNNGTCTIEMPEALLYEHDLVLRIMDLQGRLVQQSALRMNEGTIQLDIQAQAKGTYVAEVGNSKVRYTGRIVFE